MNIHNIISYIHNFDQSDKFQVVFKARGSSVVKKTPLLKESGICQVVYIRWSWININKKDVHA